MNEPDDSLEERLATLRPGRLPAALAARLAVPPALGAEKVPLLPRRRRWLAVGAVAAAAVVVMCAVFQHGVTTPSAQPAVASGSTTRVLSVTPVTQVDAGGRAWEVVEVEWEQQTAIASPSTAHAVLVQDRHRALVPVALRFD